jgi:hypothetical protein
MAKVVRLQEKKVAQPKADSREAQLRALREAREKQRLAGVVNVPAKVAAARYDQMCRAIEAAYKFDDLKEIRDKAKLLEAASRIAGNVKNEELAAKIRLRAERHAAEIEKEQGLDKGGHPRKKPTPSGGMFSGDSVAKKQRTGLRSVGATKKQAEQWRKLADTPKEDFETVASRQAVE